LRAALAAAAPAANLAPKISVVVDGGGSLHLDDIVADIRLRAVALHGAPHLHIALGAMPRQPCRLGRSLSRAPRTACCACLDYLQREDHSHACSRIDAGGVNIFKSAVTDFVIDEASPPVRAIAEPIGIHSLRSGITAVELVCRSGIRTPKLWRI